MVALLPFGVFAQTNPSKAAVHPLSAKKISAAALHTPTSASPMAYCMPALDCTDGDLISNVSFAGINNTTACSTGGYGDYTAMTNSDVLMAGQSYPISVTVGNGWPYENVSVWVDWNNDENFDTTEWTHIGNANGNPTGLVINGNLSIPAGTANGTYRMRVRVAAVGNQPEHNASACDEDQGYGETEDYTLTVGMTAPTGCLTAPNGQYPSAAYTPACDGSPANITTAGWAGEYSVVNVTAGTPYTFMVSKAGYFITISDSSGTTVLASGTDSVTYTPTATGTVRFYVHTDSACTSGTSATAHTRSVKCGNPPTEPDYGCDQSYNGTPDQANNIAKFLNYAVANDFFVPMESSTYKMNSMKLAVVPLAASGGADIGTFDIKIMSDSGTKTPGTVIHTITGVTPTAITPRPDTFATYPTFDVTLDLGGYTLPVNPAADTRYWISLQVNSVSSTSIYWIGYKYIEGWVTASNYQSSDNGATYTQITSTSSPGQHYDSIWSIDADCVLAAVNDTAGRQVAFYPNPVKDILTIEGKSPVEAVQVYNAAGQKMPIASKVVNGKVDMSKLAPGAYIIRATLQDGKTESIKVIKK